MPARKSLLSLLFVFAACAAIAQNATEKLAPYVPTPPIVAEKMLQFAGLKPGEKMFDLGSGDGRIVILAARKFKAVATGVEIDDNLWRESTEKIKKLGLEASAHIIHGDIFLQDYSPADLIAVYLLPASNDKIQPMLEKQLKKGARVVAHDFGFSGWEPSGVTTIEDDGEGRSHTLYLYRR